MSLPPKEKYAVLLVDDSADDRWFMRRALRNHPRLVLVKELGDGDQAIAYLSGQEPFADRETFPFPDVLLLDLKMPRTTGCEVLEWLQTQSFSELVVFVLSGSSLPEDIARSQQLGADGYLIKTASIEDLGALFREIEDSLRRPRARPA
jgi:CheY-like chemotaxis protein